MQKHVVWIEERGMMFLVVGGWLVFLSFSVVRVSVGLLGLCINFQFSAVGV